MDNKVNNKHANCVVYVTHRIDTTLLRYMDYLRKEMSDSMDFIILYDCHLQKINPNDFSNFKFYIFDSVKLGGFFHCGNTKLPNPLVALMDFSKKFKYEHYLLMENDVVFTGDIHTFAQLIDSLECDYIHIATDIIGGAEKHWPINYIRNNPFSHLHFSWCQLFYISHRYLADLEIFMKENNSFYYEFLLPTMAYNNGYSIRQFENFGYHFQLSWGPAEVFEYKYQYERMHNTFYHPIKNLSLVTLC